MPRKAPPPATVGDELGPRSEGAVVHPDVMALSPPRGMRDVVPPASTGLKRLRSAIMRVAERLPER